MNAEDIGGPERVAVRAGHTYPDERDDRSVELGELFTVPAAVSVQNARALVSAVQLTEQLEKALSSQAVIDQAIGILISTSGCSGAEGYEKLRTLSRNEHKKLAVVADTCAVAQLVILSGTAGLTGYRDCPTGPT